MGIIPDLNMDMYSLKRQEAGFEALLRAVAEVLLKHVDPDTVAHCARTLVHCTQHGPQATQVPRPAHHAFDGICQKNDWIGSCAHVVPHHHQQSLFPYMLGYAEHVKKRAILQPTAAVP